MSKIKVGITIGDPSGIGPAIALKAIAKLKGLADFTVIGDAWVLSKIKNQKSPFSFARGKKIKDLKLIDLGNVKHQDFGFGKIKAEYGRAALEYLDKALGLIEAGQIDCLVTCPVSKEAVRLSGREFSGHTEYLAVKTGSKDFAMMLLNRRIKFCLLTRHLPLREVPAAITAGNLETNILLSLAALKDLFFKKNARLVVCGLNPHASDNGVIGDEENKIIRPLLKKLKQKNAAEIDGPISADVAVSRAYNREYDCVIACYHDQAMIPLKMLFKQLGGVNLTVGLPFVRTSPLHGTAFDIAGRPRLANPESLIQAVKLAVRCASNLKRG